ncbi:MAG: FKBP-type peptidyl-prolyl cis-trans isomerase [Clostridia bacterium]|nr:FKBP-type peptidyl-prolyl cis-trans isomerase [Clostridia bacterium]
MNRKLYLILALLMLASLLLLASCNKGGETTDTTASDTTAAETEATTAIPRYDYMDAVVAPDVEIDRADYTGITLTVPDSLKIEDEDVEAYIQSGILFSRRTAVNGTAMVKDQALKLGDDAYIYYKGFVDGKEFEGGSNWDDEKPYTLGLGSGSFIPGFEDGLVGVIPNQTSKDNPAEIHVTFPEEYTEELAGKDAVFHVVVEYAVQYTIPELTRDFVVNTLKYKPKMEFYASDEALLDEFKEYVYGTLVDQNAQNVENAKVDALWNHLTGKATCKNLVADEVTHYFNAYKSEVEYYFDYYTSMGNEEFKKLYPDLDTFAPVYLGLDKGADWKAEVTEMAELMVKRDMITHAIAELEGIETVTEEEYKAQVKYWVDYYYGYMTEAEVIQNMGEVFLREAAFSEKMDKWLMEQVTFTYADGTPLVSNTNNEAESETAEG